MQTIIINDTHLCDKDIQKFRKKVRAILLFKGEILVSHYGGVILLPGGSIDPGETDDEAIIRELKEETGIVYNIADLEKILLLKYYQPNYPTRTAEVVNRQINTTFYWGQYRGINLGDTNRTASEVKDNFHLQLMPIDEFIASANELSDNPRKAYFDRENQEVGKVLIRLLKR